MEQLQREFQLELSVGYFMKRSNQEMQVTLNVLLERSLFGRPLPDQERAPNSTPSKAPAAVNP